MHHAAQPQPQHASSAHHVTNRTHRTVKQAKQASGSVVTEASKERNAQLHRGKKQRETVVGIDLGTTNSAVAYIEAGGKPRCIPNEEGSKTTPSVVAFLPEGEVVVGSRAKTVAARHAGTTYSSTKRLIGRRFDDPAVQQEQPRLPYQVCRCVTSLDKPVSSSILGLCMLLFRVLK